MTKSNILFCQVIVGCFLFQANLTLTETITANTLTNRFLFGQEKLEQKLRILEPAISALSKGKFDKAEAILKKVVATHPGKSLGKRAEMELSALGLFRDAKSALDKDLSVTAKLRFRKVIMQYPGTATARYAREILKKLTD